MSNCEKSTLYIICLILFFICCWYVYYSFKENLKEQQENKEIKDNKKQKEKQDYLNKQYNEKPLTIFKNMFEFPDPWRNRTEIEKNKNNDGIYK